MNRRVCVTGIGTVNPLGNSLSDSWKKVVAGESGIETIRAFDVEGFSCKVAGEVKDFNFKEYYKAESLSKVKRLDPFVHYAQAAFLEAKEQSGLDFSKNPERIGVAVGTGIGGMHTNYSQAKIFYDSKKGHPRCSPFYIPAFIGNMAAGYLSIENGMKGPNFSLQTACATGNHSLAMAYYTLRDGMADVMVSGATEAIIEPLTMAGFNSMRAMSTSYNDSPKTASRPFDKGRDGFVMGEGSAIFILEDYEFAQARGADILCELVKVGMSSDAYDMVNPCDDGAGAYQAMQTALDMGGVSVDEVDYINCHGTSTPVGDRAELQAVDRLLKNRSSEKPIHIGSTKSMTGHLIGAASAVEAAFSVMAIKNNVIPPNINIFEIDEDIAFPQRINLELVEKEVNCVLSNSFGFGGHNSVAVFKAV